MTTFGRGRTDFQVLVIVRFQSFPKDRGITRPEAACDGCGLIGCTRQPRLALQLCQLCTLRLSIDPSLHTATLGDKFCRDGPCTGTSNNGLCGPVGVQSACMQGMAFKSCQACLQCHEKAADAAGEPTIEAKSRYRGPCSPLGASNWPKHQRMPE